jgi:group I intron endonuclease
MEWLRAEAARTALLPVPGRPRPHRRPHRGAAGSGAGTMTAPYGEVYLLTCTANGKQYVGQTTYGVAHRCEQHCDNANRGRGYLIGKALRKYGPDAFTVEVLDTAANQVELDAKEIHLIATKGSLVPHGYNLQTGGNGGRPCDETRRRMSAAQTGRVHPESVKEKLRIASTGRTLSPEAREKISRRHTGRGVSEEGRQRMSLAKKGKPLSPEHAVKARVAGLGKTRSPEAIEATRQANQGRKMSPEAVEKNRQAQLKLGKKLSPEHAEALHRSRRGKTLSPEHIDAIRKTHLGRKRPDETRAKQSAAAKARGGGTPVALKAMRQANIGRVMTPEQRATLSARLKGIKRSPEACARMKAAKANITEETLEKMREAAQARPRRVNTPETKEKMRLSAIEAHRLRREKTSTTSEG